MTNVLLIMSDEHNASYTSVTGVPRVHTLNLERLAESGTVYDAAYSISPLCAPCRASFLCGLPPHQTQVYNNCRIDAKDFPSYGGELSAQGVHTALFGKVDGYRDSGDLGFSEVILGGDRRAPGDINFQRQPLTNREDGERRANGYGPRDDAHRHDRMAVDRAVEWLGVSAPAIEVPWAITVNITAPHFPHFTTQQRWDEYEDTAELPELGIDEPTAHHPYMEDLRAHFRTETFSDEQRRGLRRGYFGCIEFVDEQVGRLLDALDASGKRDETVVIYTSDHGEMLGNFGMWWKCSMLEDSLRVPLIVAGPGFGSSLRDRTAVSLFDVQATMFAATGASRPDEWWGEPLQEIGPDDHNRCIFAEYHGHGTRSGAFMIRKGDWKLIHNMAAPDQLFNIAHDPHERQNLADSEPDVLVDLDQELRNRCDPDVENRRAHAMEAEQLAWLNRDSA